MTDSDTGRIKKTDRAQKIRTEICRIFLIAKWHLIHYTSITYSKHVVVAGVKLKILKANHKRCSMQAFLQVPIREYTIAARYAEASLPQKSRFFLPEPTGEWLVQQDCCRLISFRHWHNGRVSGEEWRRIRLPGRSCSSEGPSDTYLSSISRRPGLPDMTPWRVLQKIRLPYFSISSVLEALLKTPFSSFIRKNRLISG